MDFKILIVCFITAGVGYLVGYLDGMKSNGKFQFRIGGKNNTQVMK